MDLLSAFTAINWLSVILSAFSAFLIGGIWYGPLFGKLWMEAFHFTEVELKKRPIPKTFGVSFLLSLLAAIVLEMFLGPQATVISGLTAGFLVGVGWVSTFIGILYLFEMQSLRAYLINAGYCVVALSIMGLVLGLL